MLGRLFGTGSLPALEAMLRFSSERQKVIATNIANVDTLGYRSRDLSESDFRSAMAQAYAGSRSSSVGLWTMGSEALTPGLAADAGSLKPGGNNVDLDIEMARMVKNSALHGAVASLLAQQFTLLREAIAGHVIS